jgi:acylphosphatase
MWSAKRYYVSGIVQGVGYRYFVERLARRLKLAGYVKNLPDGRVEAYAIGDEGSLERFRAELRRGPVGASVTRVSEEEAAVDPRLGESFSIDYDV